MVRFAFALAMLTAACGSSSEEGGSATGGAAGAPAEGGAGDASDSGDSALDASPTLDSGTDAALDGSPEDSGVPSCPADTLWIEGQWGNTAIETELFGTFSQNIMVVRIDVPSSFSGGVRYSSWVEYKSGPIAREAVLSTQPCDFSSEAALKNASGQVFKTAPDVQSIQFKYSPGPATMWDAHFEPGSTYYINARNRYSDGTPSCPDGANCTMRGGLPQ